MIRPSLVGLLLALGIFTIWLAPSNIARAEGPWKVSPLADGKVELTHGGDAFDITFARDNIVELNYRPKGQSGANSPVLVGLKGAVAATEIPAASEIGVTTFTTAGMKVEIDLSGLNIKISDAAGKVLCEMVDWHGDGLTVKHDHHTFHGDIGNVFAGYQGTNGGPFVWTTSGYGLLWDSDGGNVQRTDTQLVIRRGVGDNYPRPDFDGYFIVGPPRAILAGLADISGHAPMFPKWSMGFMVTHWGIDEKEMLQNVDTFREKKIPFDTYIIDYDWFNYGTDDLGDFKWNADKFPDGPSGKLCKELLASKGVKMVGIRKPRLSAPTAGPATQAAIDKGWVLPVPNGQPKGPREFNFHIQAARDWWWSQERPLFESGLVGYWNDEADVATHFHFMEMARTEYEGQRSMSNQRVWSVNRNFYIGSQRYAYALWSGDIPTGFPSMGDQRARMMHAIDGGESWWTMDGGGFHGHPTDENYARWLEFASVAPIMRVHGEKPEKREPWNYGLQAEAIAKKYIELRYRLLPYVYSGAWQTTQRGLPLVRPMWIDYSADPQVTDKMTDQWMVGDFLLARPIVDAGAASAKVYLPKGTWIDFWTGEKHEGGQEIERAVNAQSWDDLPLFVKRGAIIPTAPPMLYVGEVPIDPLTLELYPDAEKTTFTYYDDDGQTYDYEKNVYAEIPMTCQLAGDKMVFELGAKKGSYVPSTKTCVLKFHLLDDKRKPGTVTLNGQPLAQSDSATALDAKGEGWTESSDASGPIILVRMPMADGQRVEVPLN
jgi:alpha-glucosidase